MKIHLSRVKKDVKLALKEDLQNNDISLLNALGLFFLFL